MVVDGNYQAAAEQQAVGSTSKGEEGRSCDISLKTTTARIHGDDGIFVTITRVRRNTLHISTSTATHTTSR